ncbi:hypothetical protein CROQUDRAFT_654109 [Cronartium quercuum f. sp. fusiforme G11]|uniref:Uncharacterized protein n=1 Tax=Cronartium quercuum f. sp. fusiforme G11 TaxID=708437 RepID=A0A9P6NN89_9BASI|nr:hypothetical protein CROQUDRAFT_654109 [Cronartium quercuum f. sp. fusiforme G11]
MDQVQRLQKLHDLERAIETKRRHGMTKDRARRITASHIKALHEYNACKDYTQKLLGMIGSIEGTTLKETYERFDLSPET